MECPSCSQPQVTGLVCQCGAIMPPRPLNKFEALDLEPRFAVTADELEAHYRELSRKVHPDRFAMADPRQRMLSLQAATTLNDAYRELRAPDKRAEHLLHINGVNVSEKDKSNPAFLMEMMELREELSEAKADPARLAALGRTMQTRYDKTLEDIAHDFAQYEQSRDHVWLGRVKNHLFALRFFQRYLDEVEAGLDSP